MKKVILFIFAMTVLASCENKKADPAEIVGKTAKVYYDYLLHGNYDAFVDGTYRKDSIPPAYREQLLANAKMFVGQQKEEHRGIKDIRIADAKIDTLRHVGSAFLILAYGDRTTEEIVVPMVEVKKIWYMK